MFVVETGRLHLLKISINRDLINNNFRVTSAQIAPPKMQPVTNMVIEFAGGKKVRHHKFCIIDLRTVVHGSYNWTIKAQYNEETVTVNHSADFAAEFGETFMKLKKATDNDVA